MKEAVYNAIDLFTNRRSRGSVLFLLNIVYIYFMKHDMLWTYPFIYVNISFGIIK